MPICWACLTRRITSFLSLCWIVQVRSNKRYAAAAERGFAVEEVARNVENDIGKIDIIVHSLANGPEVKKPLLETSRQARFTTASAAQKHVQAICHKHSALRIVNAWQSNILFKLQHFMLQQPASLFSQKMSGQFQLTQHRIICP